MAGSAAANSSTLESQRACEDEGDDAVGDSVRPVLRKDERRWIEQVRSVDEEMGAKCYVCGVEGEVEELSEAGADEDEEAEEVDVIEGGDRRCGGGEVRRYRAVKDERALKNFVDPRRPTQTEIEEHERTHLPYRNWCPICVRAKGRDLDHRKATEQERGLSEYSFDYCFPGDELGCKLTVLVGRERVTGTYSATTVPMKGSIGRFTVEKMMDVIDEVGDSKQTIIMKTDQENSAKMLIEDIVQEREEGRTIVEESPTGSSGSNGVVERAVQSIEGQIRVVLLALEHRIGRQIDPQEPIVAFMPEYAAYVLNRLEVGRDGKTAYERARGKKATVVGLEFGEKLLWRKKKGDKMAKLRSRWAYGIFVGVRRRSGELWVANKRGEIVKVRAVKRIPFEDRWSEDCASWVRYAPWNKCQDDPEADGDIPDEKVVEATRQARLEFEADAEHQEDDLIKKKYVKPRSFKITIDDAERYGYTRGCPGCTSWHRGLARQAHTHACRKRFENEMKNEAKVLRAKEQEEEFKRKVAKRRRIQEEAAKKEVEAERCDEGVGGQRAAHSWCANGTPRRKLTVIAMKCVRGLSLMMACQSWLDRSRRRPQGAVRVAAVAVHGWCVDVTMKRMLIIRMGLARKLGLEAWTLRRRLGG